MKLIIDLTRLYFIQGTFRSPSRVDIPKMVRWLEEELDATFSEVVALTTFSAANLSQMRLLEFLEREGVRVVKYPPMRENVDFAFTAEIAFMIGVAASKKESICVVSDRFELHRPLQDAAAMDVDAFVAMFPTRLDAGWESFMGEKSPVEVIALPYEELCIHKPDGRVEPLIAKH